MRSFTSKVVYGSLFCALGVVSACHTSTLVEGSGADRRGQGGCGPDAPGNNVPVSGPGFPGAGNAGAGAPISVDVNVSSCGSSANPSGGTTQGPVAVDCYFTNSNQGVPAAIVERIVETVKDQQLVHVRLTLNPVFVDNTYGANAIGWGSAATTTTTTGGGMPMMGGGMPKPGGGAKGHTFKDLVGSDKAEFKMTDGQGTPVLDFYLDYLSVDAAKPSGYGSLGVTGGDGKMLVGNASAIVAFTTSLDRDLNSCGYGSYTVDSPATDASYTPSAATPNWDYRVVYDVWVNPSAFGAAGFGNATITYVHASPSKFEQSSVPVTPGPCPPPACGCVGEGCNSGPPACLADGVECGNASDCCDGFCTENVCGRPACQQAGGACQTNVDCCADTDVCTEGQCTQFQPPM